MAGTARTPPAGRLIAGRYRLGSELGRGGMASVYAATDEDLDRGVALKLLHPELAHSENIRRRFLREARAAANLTNRHVALVFDVGTDNDASASPYIVMEKLRGRDLRHELVLAERLPVAQAVDYVLQASVALAEAHARGIVHRDLKPSNLFVAERPDGSKQLKVLDFGIAKAMESDGSDAGLTSCNAVLGSPRYMSPEQLRASANLDARTDLWALGVVLYELLSGTPPFAGHTVAEMNAAVLEHTAAPLSTHCAVPAALETAIHRCLAKDPSQRIPNVVALAAAIAPFGSATATEWVRAAEGYAVVRDVGRETAPAIFANANVESVIESGVDSTSRDDVATLLAPTVGSETDTSWNTSVARSAQRTRRWVMGAAVVAVLSTAAVLAWQSGDHPRTATPGILEEQPLTGAAAPNSQGTSADTIATRPTPMSATSAAPSSATSVSPHRSPLRWKRPTAPEPTPYDERD